MKKLFIIDLMPFLYKGHFVFLRNPRLTSTGINTSALIGFANGVMSILKDNQPTHVVLAMDPGGPTFRHTAYPPYKAQREKMPEDLAASIPYAFALAEALNIPVVRCEGFEADDVMGTLAAKGAAAGFEVYCATPDKDAAQLVGEHINLFRPGHGKDPAEIYDEEKVKEHWHLASAKQMIDYLALAGDTADNIPGIRGVGEKTAAQLLADYGTVENIIAHAAELKGKLAEKIANGAEDAKMSKCLTTIRTDVPLDCDLEAFVCREPDREKLTAVCAKFELFQFARRFGVEVIKTAPAMPATSESPAASAPAVKPFLAEPHDYRLVTKAADARALADELAAASVIGFDTETTGINAQKDRLVGMSFATAPGKAWYVAVPPHAEETVGGEAVPELDLFAAALQSSAAGCSFDEAKDFVGVFAKIFADPAKTFIAHNAKFDMTILGRYGITFGATVHDTMLEHYVLDAAARHNKEQLAREVLGFEPEPIEHLIGAKERGKEQKSMADLPPEAIRDYAAQDADLALRWEAALRPKVGEAGALRALEESEEPLVPILIAMEKEGVALDVKALRNYGVQLDREIGLLVDSIRRFGEPGLNIDSPKQLGALLFEKLKLDASGVKKTSTGQYATDEKTLQKLIDYHPVVWDILEYRACSKLKSTYVDKLPLCLGSDGRVHTTFAQAFTETGRLSSSDPNLQNIPVRSDRGKNIRAAIVPRDKDHLLIAADYSQIELRILAAMSGDENLLAAFRNGADIHRETAARVYGVAPEAVTPDQRSRCKMVNFGIVYGISAFGLAQRLKIARREAGELIDTYFKLYPKVRAFMDKAIADARATGYAVTALGRRRTLRDINSRNATARQSAERDAMNTPVQGTAADLIKLAMVRVDRALKAEGLKAKMVLQIHDELLFDTPRSEVEAVKALAKREMEGALDLGVPLEVSAGVGENWLEAH
ncbi:MAG: DNA polymerase I [Kiritimatiellae bacterium]|nr:DNA polymerase I [Kiritimatiellia bacterium]